MTNSILELMSNNWESEQDNQTKGKIAEVAVYLLCTVCGGLRGEEVTVVGTPGSTQVLGKNKNQPHPSHHTYPKRVI